MPFKSRHNILHLTDKAVIRIMCLGLALTQAPAKAATELDSCLLSALKSADATATAEQIRASCFTNKAKAGPELTGPELTGPELTGQQNKSEQATALAQISPSNTLVANGLISNRLIAERNTAFDPFVITPHKMNYLLPASITDNVNTSAYQDVDAWSENLTNTEAKFQLSIKVPLNRENLLLQDDGLFFGFTLQSWWQVYSDNISKPFRETNYQPEIFYLAPLNWHPAGGNTGFALGLEHQSNGRSQMLSRSWNRLYLNFLYEKDNFALSFRPWWRLPESEKQTPLDSDGDDNPDIIDYMGHFELGLVYQWSDYEWTTKFRENFARHHGALELGLTFPLWGKLRGYAQYSLGYGESLIDYNHSQQRFGLGIALTNVL